MQPVPDENDVVYETYGLDIAGIFRAIYEKIVGNDFDAFQETLSHLWNIYSVIAILFSIVLFLGYIYAKIRFEQLSEIEMAGLKEAEHMSEQSRGAAVDKNSRWNDIMNHISHHSPSEWKLAIIEADILLDETLEKAGYIGASIGDKLKSAKSAPFNTLQDAWEAHKIRNRIAHSGGDFLLTKKIAQETIVRFERVFKEFGAI